MSQFNCVVVLLGLPASGKTFLAGKICSYLSSEQFKVKLFSFDALCSLEKQAEIANRSSIDSFKSYRSVMKAEVDSFLCALNPLNERRIAIVDDNNYYRSMRYEYYQIAAKCSAGFLQIFVQCESTLALKMNSQRPCNERVPDEVITQMKTKLELPCEPWENTFLIRRDESSNSNLSVSIKERIEESCSKPVKMYQELLLKEAESQKSRVTNDSSLLHIIDKILRRLIGRRIQNRDKEVDSRVLANHLNEKRLAFMKSIKSGLRCLPNELANSDDEFQLESWVEASFNSQE